MKNKKNYEILQSPVNDYGFLVLSRNFESMTDEFTKISRELVRNNFRGKILLDYLLSKGSFKERFFEIYFNGKDFDTKTFKLASNIHRSLESLSINYYGNHYDELIENSILSKPVKHFIRNRTHN